MFEETYSIIQNDFENAGKISSHIKSVLKQLGIPSEVLRRIAVACYEAEINCIIHSLGGTITLQINEEGVIILKFDDVGPGIEDIEQALTPGYSTASQHAREFGFGAGMGLPNIKRVSDQFEITTSPNGTHLRLEFHL